MDIFKLLNEQMNDKDTLCKLGGSVGARPSQVQQLAQIGLPALLQTLGCSAATSEGAASFVGALDQHKDDDVDDREGLMQGFIKQLLLIDKFRPDLYLI